MDDLPFKNLPPNQRDLERAEQGSKFPAEPEEVDIKDELQFYLYPFAKMEVKLLKVLPTCTRPNFGLTFELDPQYGRAYVLDVDNTSSAAKLFSSLKATRREVRLSYIKLICARFGQAPKKKRDSLVFFSRFYNKTSQTLHHPPQTTNTLTATR